MHGTTGGNLSTWLFVVAAALLLPVVLLLLGLSILQGLGESFRLLDRANRLARLRTLLLAAGGVTAACIATLGSLAMIGDPPADASRSGPVRESGALPAADPPVDVAGSPAENVPAVTRSDSGAPDGSPANVEPAPGTEADGAPMAEPDPGPEPEPEPEPEPSSTPESELPASSDWRLARVVSGGDITLRAWPNGSAISMLSPGERVLTREQLQRAGGHEWEKVRLPDGTEGWVVERFVQPDR